MPLHHVVTTTETGIQITTSVGTTHELVLVPEGPFAMGANNGIRNEGPEHTVSLKAYYIDRTEISNAQWNAYAIAGHVRPNLNTPDHPVVNVAIHLTKRTFCILNASCEAGRGSAQRF